MFKKDSTPKISIIIPCYNAEEYISQCLESIVNQTYSNLEIICVNDGSIDNTLFILKKYQERDKRIKIINQENHGLAFTRNSSIREATGDFLMFVDNDDWIDLITVEELMKLDRHDDVIIFSYCREFTEISLPKDLQQEGHFKADEIQRLMVGPINNELINVENVDSLVTVWGKMYRNRKYLQDLQFLDLKDIGTWDDGIFNLQVFQQAEKILIVNKPFYHYRKNNINSITALYKKGLPQMWQNKFKWIHEYLTVRCKSEIYFKALDNRICMTFLGLCLNEMYNKDGFRSQFMNIKKNLHEPLYIEKFKNFEMRYLPTHWKIFYFFVKKRFTMGVLILSKIIHAIIQKNN